jgi:hypothetical protein
MNDELDGRRARQYAWMSVKPGEPFGLPREPEGDNEPTDELLADGEGELAEEKGEGEEDCEVDSQQAQANLEALRREGFAAADALAAGVDRTWVLRDVEPQARAVEALLQRASEMGLSLAAMQHHPLQSARLLRLSLQHYERLSASSREHAHCSCIWLDYTHPEAGEVIIEAAVRANRAIAESVYMAVGGLGRDEGVRFGRRPDFSRRLAQVLDEGPTWISRTIALLWLERAGEPDAVPAIRRALRQPHLGVRWLALSALHQRFPDALTAEDVLFLLDDAVIHPPPVDLRQEEVTRAVYYYPQELAWATGRVRPPGGEVPLCRIVQGKCVYIHDERGDLDPGWALNVLAASYPEPALPLVDRWLKCVDGERRLWAVNAAARLPGEEAWPRLLTAAADGAPYIAECARQHWLTGRGAPAPLDELAGLPVGLYDGPPTEKLSSRLIVLRGRSREAQETMVEVLLSEAPDPEALALLVVALADDSVQGYRRPGLPKGRREWGKELIVRFGVPGVQGLCELSARYPVGRFGWLSAINDLLGNDVIPPAALPLVQAAAVRRLAEGRGDGEYEALVILRQTIGPCGAPPEVFERVWRTATDPTAVDHVRGAAAKVLASWHGDPQLDSSVMIEMEAAFAERDWPRFSWFAAIALPRKIDAALALAERVLCDHAGDAPEESLIQALSTCCRGLHEAGRLEEAWLLSALAEPASAGFMVAARRSKREATLAVRKALRRAFTKTPVDSAAAVEAAIVLLRLDAISVRHPRLAGLCARAPLPARGELIADLIHQRAPLSYLWEPLAELLTSADVPETVQRSVSLLPWRRCRAQVLEILPRVTDEKIRSIFAIYLKIPTESATYWQDGKEQDP